MKILYTEFESSFEQFLRSKHLLLINTRNYDFVAKSEPSAY